MALVGVNEILWVALYLYEIDGKEKYEYKGNNLLITRIIIFIFCFLFLYNIFNCY